MKNSKGLLVLILIAYSLLLVSCGKTGSTSSSATASPTPTATAASDRTPAAIWVQTSTVVTYGVSAIVSNCVNYGITDIFMMVKGTSGTFRTDLLDSMISLAHARGIKVHAWVIVLKDTSVTGYDTVGTGWIDPQDTDYRDYIINSIITPLVTGHDIDGIQLDCIRYPGNAASHSGAQAGITAYCNAVHSVIGTYKPALSLSVAIMAEKSVAATAYGQNVAALSAYLDFITPMTYIHNYDEDAKWVGEQVKYFVGQCVSGCSVWAGIQTLDDEGDYLTTREISEGVTTALANGATGIAFFRYPLTGAQGQWVQSWTSSL